MDRIDFVKNPRDFRVLVLAASGFSNRCIAEQTGFSILQIQARLHKFQTICGKRKEKQSLRWLYRNGENNLAKRMIRFSWTMTEQVQGADIRSSKQLTAAMTKTIDEGVGSKPITLRRAA